jgi:DNA-binding NarL/FixJ family response regulator
MNKEIAAELGVAVSTIERHLVNLYTKIGARGRADAIACTLRHRLDDLPRTPA